MTDDTRETEAEIDARILAVALKALVHAVKTYQFSPADSAEKSLAARDLDDAVDDAKSALEGRT